MDSAPISQGPDPNPSTASVDARRLLCSAMPANPVSKVLDGDNTSSWPALVPPLDDENLLEEILLRLPPKPSSLPRASLVCTRWRSVLSDPEFLKRYRKHHRKPPLLGFFVGRTSTYQKFVPLLGMKPDRIPTERFARPKSSSPYQQWHLLGCRHGLAILLNEYRREVVVWDPLTGQQHCLPFPPGLRSAERDTFWAWHAVVLCGDADDGHVHGDCFLSKFKLVLTCGGDTQASACLYESTSGEWGNIASTTTTNAILRIRPSVLIRNAFCWLICGGGILTFDIERQSLDVIEKPVDAYGTDYSSFQLLQTNESGLGFAAMSKLGIQLWKRSSNSDDVVGWLLQPEVIQLEGLFPRRMPSGHKMAAMVGYDEESNMIVVATYIRDFMLQLESMQFKRISERNYLG